MKQTDSTERMLYLLKTRGPQTARQLADAIKITAMGARQLLLKLRAEGSVKDHREVHGRGRPKQVWSLTDRAHERFGDRHAELTLHLIDGVRETLGEAALDALIQTREQHTLASYRAALSKCSGLDQKVTRLAELRSAEGYMAQCRRNADGDWLLLENHCPICAAARHCQGFCRSELRVFEEVLGARVERTEYIPDGARRCAYRIRAKNASD